MSHTNETLHYHLPQYEGTDIINPLVDTNEAYADIDEALYNIASSAAEAVTKADEVEQKIEGTGGVDSRIDALVVRMDAVEAKDVSQDASILSLNSGLATTDSNLATVINNVSTLDATVSGHTTSIGQLNTRVGACENADTALDVRVTALENASPSAPTAANVSYDNTTSGLTGTDVQSAIDETVEAIDDAKTEFRQYLGELQTTTLTAGQTSATVTYTNQEIVSTSILTPVCSKYGVSPTNVTYTSNTMTLTFEAQAEDMIVGARVQNVV